MCTPATQTADLDFAVPKEATGLMILDIVQGAEMGGFQFSVSEFRITLRNEGRA